MTSIKGNRLRNILDSINKGETQLPDFQREWVWEDRRIRALIASVTNDYPIGAAMLLEYAGSDAHFKCRPIAGVTDPEYVEPRYLVLDGQQRFTSLYRSLFSKKVVDTKDDNKNAIKRFYYLNIPLCLDTLTDRIDAVVSVPEDKILRENIGRDIKLDLSTTEKEYENRYFPLNIVFDNKAFSKWQMGYFRYYNKDEETNLLDKFCEKVLDPIWSCEIPVITLDNKVPKEAVCQVFENVNQGGVSLTVFELVTATFAADNFELRKDWEEIWKELEKSPIIKYGRHFPAFNGTDFLTAMTLLVNYYKSVDGTRALSCKKKDVLSLKLEDYRANRDRLLAGIREMLKFVKEEHIYACNDLPYSSQLIPLSVLFAIDANRWFGAINREKLRRWYWCGIFGELYGGATDTRYVRDVAEMIAWVDGGGVVPDTIERSNFHASRLLNLYTRNSAAYKGVMALILKNGAIDFINGGHMDFAKYLDEATDIHHIFPQHYCEQHNIPSALWNSVVNKTPIYAQTNRFIGGEAPSVYAARIEKKYELSADKVNEHVATHCIDIEAFRSDDFNAYFRKRAYALCDLIERATGKAVDGREGLFEEE